jgi:hypothetical protein
VVALSEAPDASPCPKGCGAAPRPAPLASAL